MILKSAYDYRVLPRLFTVEEAVEHKITHTDDNDYSGQIECLEHQVERLIDIVGRLVAGQSAEDILGGYEPASEKEIKTWNER